MAGTVQNKELHVVVYLKIFYVFHASKYFH